MNRTLPFSTLVLGFASLLFPQGPARHVAIDWKDAPQSGRVTVTNGKVTGLRLVRGRGVIEGNRFAASQPGPYRLELSVEGSAAQYGPQSTLVTIQADRNPFSFFLHDVRPGIPIFIPSYGAVVTPAQDSRTYHEIEDATRILGLSTKIKALEGEPEESFERAAAQTRSLSCQTWL